VAGVEIRHLRYLVAAGECGSFTRAAAMLEVETSALSRTIHELENLLGVSLFERHARGVRPTGAGSEYLTDARDILVRLERAGGRAADAGAGRLGHLTLGYVWSFARGSATDLITEYRDKNPRVVLHLVENGPDALIGKLRQHELDLMLTATPAPERLLLGGLTDMNTLPLWPERLFAVVPDEEPRTELTWMDLSPRTLLYRRADAAPAFVRWVEDLGGPKLSFEPQDCSHEGLLALVAAGAGWTLLPESLADRPCPKVRVIPIISEGALFQVVAVWHRHTDNPALARFVALARGIHGGRSVTGGGDLDEPS
jgi:DNA-binding transcriptional LysR family regulator